MSERRLPVLDYESALDAASEFVSSQSQSGEMLLVGATRGALDDLLRLRCRDTAGVHRTTLAQLTAQLASDAAGERGLAPLNRLGEEALAARATHRVASNAGLVYFGPVSASPGFARALSRTLRELRMAETDWLALAGTGPPGADLAALHAVYEELLAEGRLADFADLTRLAAAAASDGAHRFDRLPLLLLDCPVTSALVERLVGALSARATNTLVIELTEAEPAGEAQSSLEQLRRNLFAVATPVAREPDGSFDCFSAAGEGLEATEIARRIHRAAAQGTPFDRIAVLLRSPERYQPLLEEAFSRAGVPCFFTHGSVRPDKAGRAFLALLACANERFTATRFAEYLSLGQAPDTEHPRAKAAGAGVVGTEDELFSRDEFVADAIGDSGPAVSPATPAKWEQLIVDAAVIGGRDRWQRRLAGLGREMRLRLEEARDDEALSEHIERQIGLLANLERLALPAIERLDALPKSASWGEWIEALSGLAQMTLRRPDSVMLALNELWPMSEVSPVTLDEVFLVLSDRLRFLRRPPRRRRYGQVWIGSIDEARGYVFDLVFLPGLAEGVFPKKALEDPLLLDEHRVKLEAALTLREDRVAEERARLRIAAACAKQQLVASYPRMDVSQNRPRVPSFYAIETVRAAEGRLPSLKTFERRAAAGSMTRLGWPAPRDTAESVDDLEFDLSALQRALGEPAGHARGRARYLFSLNDALARSLRARNMRWKRKWSPADGLVSQDAPTLAALAGERLRERAWSASSLQHFAACPYRFLLHGVLRLKPREAPSPLEEMDPLTRGSLFHEVIFEFYKRTRAEGSEQDLDAVLDEVAARMEEELAPAIPRVWRGEVEDVRADLRGWLRRLGADRASWELLYCEYAFGMPGGSNRDPASTASPAVVLDGVRLRGAMDWVERHRQAGVLRITDHKTGRTPKDTPRHVGRGRVLQPLLYALAAENLFAERTQFGRLYYATHRGSYGDVPIPVTEGARRDVELALKHIDDAIAQGWLPAAPAAQEDCDYCDYRAVCGPREAERVKRKPPLVMLESLRGMP